MTDPEAVTESADIEESDGTTDGEEEDEPLDDLGLEAPEADSAEQHRVVPIDEDEYR
jgi:hypothetical protein